jgi:type IV pilus assembly protein PilC
MATTAAAVKKKDIKEFTYTWEGTDKKGKRVRGDMRAGGEAVVQALLRRQGINVLKVKKQSSFGKKNQGYRQGCDPFYPSNGHHDESRRTLAAGF